MKEEKLNNAGWKNNLENTAGLQDYILQDKNAAWEKLHSRLNNKQRSNKLWFYYMAAACVALIAFSFFFFINNKKNNDVTINSSVKTQTEKPVTKQISPEKNFETKQKVFVDVKTTSPVINHKKTKENIIKEAGENIKDSFTEPVMLTQNQTVLPGIADTIKQSLTAVIPLQKKLKVVHINELDDNDNINLSQNRSHVPLRIKFLNRDIYTDYSVQLPNNGINVLKLNSSPSN